MWSDRRSNGRLGGQLQSVTSTRRWTTDGVDPDLALSYWIDTVCDRFLELEIDSPKRADFHASLDQSDFGPGTINLICADVQRVRRTSAKIARTRQASFMLMQLRAGRVRVEQSGRATTLYPGECVLIDGTEPYEVECPQPTRSLVLQLPDEWLRRYLANPEALVPLQIAGGGWCAALCAALASLDVEDCDDLALPPAEVVEHIGALLRLALRSGRAGAEGRSPIERLMRTICGRLAEPNLTPRTVAAEHRISVRGVHYAFAAAGTTFVEALMRVRLEHARELLADRRMRDVPVAEIAACCGFMDPSHFARRFRRAFGVSPLTFRSRAAH